ncbi:hypothetical protein K438DRAFT_1796467 [Mycena galopus ATCC 62051]|nr:hypothetical protein K438DRAFT_1796467 [Mycena galopus ATCC 62051]
MGSELFSKRCRECRCRAMGRCATRLPASPLPLSFPLPPILPSVYAYSTFPFLHLPVLPFYLSHRLRLLHIPCSSVYRSPRFPYNLPSVSHFSILPFLTFYLSIRFLPALPF